MSSTINFDFNAKQVRLVELEGEPWFVAADVLYVLGHAQQGHGSILMKLDADDTSLERIKKGG